MLARTERYVRAGIEPQFPKLLMQVFICSKADGVFVDIITKFEK
jgi:hypothetical protein